MDTYLAVASRRDRRSYADRPVPKDVQRRILDAGRLAGSSRNRQPWTFVLVESPHARERLAETVYTADNIRTCTFAVAIVTAGGKYPLDVGRAMQNMFLERLERRRRLVPERHAGPGGRGACPGP